MNVHHKGSKARILLTSVFGPYAQDDEYGSRAVNPMELFHNQVTRSQGTYSLRMFHRSWGIMMIQENISAPSTVLDFPTQKDFELELTTYQYDIVGISSIIVNVGKVKEMCRIVRRLSPNSVIVVGGHVTAIPEIENIIDADHIVKGDGISWMRRFLGEDEKASINHSPILSGFGHRIMGLKLPVHIGNRAATIIPSVGCPMGCNFCTTSSFFGGKGKFLNFYDTGEELFQVMTKMEKQLNVSSFFIMDENFLLYKKRALGLLERMQQEGKSWEFFVFASANAIRKYKMEELVALGVSWLWIGLESEESEYSKLNGVDTREMSQQLRQHGIKLLGSTIVGLEHHTPENIRKEIEFAVSHETDFHQFMLYTPVPGTPLYQEISQQGRLLDVDLADIHGQHKFNFKHKAISRNDSKRFLDWAFQKDFETNGPSLYRICRTSLEGWKRYNNHSDLRIRKRFNNEINGLKYAYSGMLWVMEKRLKKTNRVVAKKIKMLRQELIKEFSIATKIGEIVLGPLLWWCCRREEKRMANGVTYEPKTITDRRNWC